MISLLFITAIAAYYIGIVVGKNWNNYTKE